MSDDSFELYDLRVEVVIPPGKRIMCGAKEGDFFTLHGEMLYLPPGQGFSIYSLGGSFPYPPSLRGLTPSRCGSATSGGETEVDSSERLDVYGR